MTPCDKYQHPLWVTYDPCDINTTILQSGTKFYKKLTKMDFALLQKTFFFFALAVCHTVMTLRIVDIAVKIS